MVVICCAAYLAAIPRRCSRIDILTTPANANAYNRSQGIRYLNNIYALWLIIYDTYGGMYQAILHSFGQRCKLAYCYIEIAINCIVWRPWTGCWPVMM